MNRIALAAENVTIRRGFVYFRDPEYLTWTGRNYFAVGLQNVSKIQI